MTGLNESVVEEAALTTLGERFKGRGRFRSAEWSGRTSAHPEKTKTLAAVLFPRLFCLKRRASA